MNFDDEFKFDECLEKKNAEEIRKQRCFNLILEELRKK